MEELFKLHDFACRERKRCDFIDSGRKYGMEVPDEIDGPHWALDVGRRLIGMRSPPVTVTWGPV